MLTNAHNGPDFLIIISIFFSPNQFQLGDSGKICQVRTGSEEVPRREKFGGHPPGPRDPAPGAAPAASPPRRVCPAAGGAPRRDGRAGRSRPRRRSAAQPDLPRSLLGVSSPSSDSAGAGRGAASSQSDAAWSSPLSSAFMSPRADSEGSAARPALLGS